MATIRLHPSGQEVTIEQGETVLTALERAGYALPATCRAAQCGECKAKVLGGAFDHGTIHGMAVTAQEQAQGYGLMCLVEPAEDVLEIEWGTADAQPLLFPPQSGVPFVVIDAIPRTPSIKEFRLRPVADPLRYWPGQYVMAGDPSRGVPKRAFSIGNAPRADGEITLFITRVPGAVTSEWAHEQLVPGSRVALDGPYGTFIGDPSVSSPVLCLAAGAGLAPILALTESALRRGFHEGVTLVFVAEEDHDVYDQGMMAFWEARHPTFRFVRVLEDRDAREGHHELVATLEQSFSDLSEHSVFAAGSPAFVEVCAAAAHRLGARPERVHTEGYHRNVLPETPPADHLRD